MPKVAEVRRLEDLVRGLDVETSGMAKGRLRGEYGAAECGKEAREVVGQESTVEDRLDDGGKCLLCQHKASKYRKGEGGLYETDLACLGVAYQVALSLGGWIGSGVG
jgi:hypothetical protein